ncbi:threonine/serine exporter family protein [Citricoccus sp. NPDC055426]|uniref:threonine/serine ThrE exporter family protein n=1 Tax=Citricoccus sp. NPDC055426 TaxID=3155536 RepID=UPI0034161A18
MEENPDTRRARRHAQEPPVELTEIPIIRSSRAASAPVAGDPEVGEPAAGKPEIRESPGPEPESAVQASTSAIDFPLGPAAGRAEPVRTDSGTTVVGGPDAPGGDAAVVPQGTEPAAEVPLTDTPLTEPPASDPVPQSVLSPAGPVTGETPATAPVGTLGVPAAKKPPKGRLRFSGGSAFKRMMYSEPLPTQTLSIVNRIADSPYANPYLRTTRNADADARTTLDFALKLGETMFRFGAGALEVETSIIVVTQAFGVHETEVDITNQSIALNYAPSGKTPYSLHRVVRSWSQNYAGLALLHQLVSGVSSGEMDRDSAQQRLADIRHKPKPFAPWLTILASGIFAAAFTAYIGAGLIGAGVALLSTMLLIGTVNLMGKARIPEFFSIMVGGFIATVIALTLYTLHVPLAPSLVVAGGIMLLLPSGRFVSAMQDAINGFPVSAAGRFVSAVLVFAGLMAGIIAAVVFSSILGVPELDLADEAVSSHPIWLLGILVVVATAADGIFDQSAWRLLIPTALVSLVGFLVFVGAEALGTGPRLTPGIAAVAIGALGRYVALRMGAPQLVVAVPGILFLLPGLKIFRSMYNIAMNSGAMQEGLVGLFDASAVIMAIAAGVVLGDTIARPLTRALQANERRRIGRR